MYFLEQLVGEWYALRGFFVRTNILFGRRKQGGYEGEIDVAAFNPKTKELIHLEISMDANSWNQRKERFKKKFKDAERHYRSVFDFEFKEIKKIAVVSFARPRQEIDFGDNIELLTIPDLIARIKADLTKINSTNTMIPEGYPLMRAIQFAIWF